jgi:Domain of unknown function (DUF4160)
MAEAEIPLDPELVAELENSFFHGPMLNEAGVRGLIEVTVAFVGGMAIVIKGAEHPPPHFHVKYQGADVPFSISECRRLFAAKGLEAYEYNIRNWWKKNKAKLVDTWNSSRPSDCQVGPIRV